MSAPMVLVRSLASLLHPASSKWKALVVFKAFFDESGAHGGPDDVFTVGGFVARESHWTGTLRVWDRKLRHRVFHITDFENRRGEFAQWPSEKQRIPLISALANSIQTHEVFGTAHSVEFRPFWEILCPEETVHHAKRLAYGLLLTSCLNDLVYLFKVPSNERLSAVCEECAGVEGFATDCFYYFKRNEAKHFSQITFAKKEEFRGLQAADMMAYEGFKHVTNQAIKSETRPVRKLLQALQKSDRLAVAYAGEKEITTFANSWKDIIDRVVAGDLSAADGGEQ